jgi:hypothetical protein
MTTDTVTAVIDAEPEEEHGAGLVHPGNSHPRRCEGLNRRVVRIVTTATVVGAGTMEG